MKGARLGRALDYQLVPGELRDEAGQVLADFCMPRAAAFGEPWLRFFTPTEIARLLLARGMVVTEEVGHGDQVEPRSGGERTPFIPTSSDAWPRAQVTG